MRLSRVRSKSLVESWGFALVRMLCTEFLNSTAPSTEPHIFSTISMLALTLVPRDSLMSACVKRTRKRTDLADRRMYFKRKELMRSIQMLPASLKPATSTKVTFLFWSFQMCGLNVFDWDLSWPMWKQSYSFLPSITFSLFLFVSVSSCGPYARE